MSPRYIRLEAEGPVARLTLDRPPLNILHLAMLEELVAVLAEVRAHAALKVLVVSGAGRGFCAGVDVADHTADRAERMLSLFHRVIQDLMSLDVPAIAAVHGAALGGGCELALACDLILTQEEARFGQPEIRLAVFPPVAAVVLPRLVGRQAALDLVLTGRVVSGTEALAMGLVSHAWPAERFGAEVENYVQGLAGMSRPVLQLAKRAVDEGLDRPFGPALEHAEALYLNDLMRLGDPHEGLAAFMEKRKPTWREA